MKGRNSKSNKSQQKKQGAPSQPLFASLTDGDVIRLLRKYFLEPPPPAHRSFYGDGERVSTAFMECTPSEFQAVLWIAVVRDGYRMGRLSQEDLAAIEDIPGWTWPPRQVLQ
jgi:hypothetical protein